MTIRTTTTQPQGRPLAWRAAAVVMAALLVLCFQASPLEYALAAKSDANDTAQTADSNKKSNSLSAPATKSGDDAMEEDDLDENDEEDEESEEDRAKREAAELRAQAKTIVAQGNATKVALKAAKADYEQAKADLEEAQTELADAEEEYKKKSAEIDELEESLAAYVVDMYKQGGVTPYLDVMLGATSYQEFLTSWTMATEVSQYGQEVVDEKRRIREEIEAKIERCEEEVESAKKAKSTAETKKRQTEATLLALASQAARLNLEATKLDGTKREVAAAQEKYDDIQERYEKALALGLAGGRKLSGTGYFTHPLPNSTVSSGFGYRTFDNAAHQGIDFAAAEGTPYYAADSGKVIAATNGGDYNGGAGNWIVIDHGNGVVTKYMHSLVTFVSPGDRVVRGQNIGLVGTTGQSTGPHLHFQVEMGGVPVNPANYL